MAADRAARGEFAVSALLLLGVGLLGWRIDWQFVRGLDYALLWQYRLVFLQGLGVSLMFAVAGVAVGYPAGALLAVLSFARWRLVRWCVFVFVEFWRNTPLLVQIFWVHFALPMLTHIETTPVQSGFVALSANVAAYYSEIVRAGIGTIARGQWDAAHALGLRNMLTWRLVVLPQALRIVLPPSASLVLGVFKGTSVLSILAIGDLMQEAIRVSGFTFHFVEPYTLAALLYVLVGLAISHAARRLERPALR